MFYAKKSLEYCHFIPDLFFFSIVSVLMIILSVDKKCYTFQRFFPPQNFRNRKGKCWKTLYNLKKW